MLLKPFAQKKLAENWLWIIEQAFSDFTCGNEITTVRKGQRNKRLWTCSTRKREDSDQTEQMWLWTDTAANPPQRMSENTFLSWTFMCFFPFLSVAANSYIPKGNRNFSAALKLLPWCNQSKKPNNNHLFHGNVTRIKLEKSGCCWETLYSPLPLYHFTTV